MEQPDHQPRQVDLGETSAFTIWLGRTLRLHNENAVNEPIPMELMALLPPPTKER